MNKIFKDGKMETSKFTSSHIVTFPKYRELKKVMLTSSEVERTVNILSPQNIPFPRYGCVGKHLFKYGPTKDTKKDILKSN